MNTEQVDQQVKEVCAKYKWVVPENWCYPGDLIFDNHSESFFICGDDPKDVAELRRRSVSFKKVDLETLKQFLIDRKGHNNKS